MARSNPTHPMDDVVADNAALRREVGRLRAWLRWWAKDTRDEHLFTMTPVDQLRDCIAGKPAPRKVKR